MITSSQMHGIVPPGQVDRARTHEGERGRWGGGAGTDQLSHTYVCVRPIPIKPGPGPWRTQPSRAQPGNSCCSPHGSRKAIHPSRWDRCLHRCAEQPVQDAPAHHLRLTTAATPTWMNKLSQPPHSGDGLHSPPQLLRAANGPAGPASYMRPTPQPVETLFARLSRGQRELSRARMQIKSPWKPWERPGLAPKAVAEDV